jgi:alkylated DNA repair protein (DNA oxidative demethylase)
LAGAATAFSPSSRRSRKSPLMPCLPQTETPPAGLVYKPGLVSRENEADLLAAFVDLDFQAIVIRGQAARRTARHYGVVYDYAARGRLEEGDLIPGWLLPLRRACAGLAGLVPGELAEALVQRYPPGATIGWHRDAPVFGTVVGVSLLSACRMRFRRTVGGDPIVFERVLERRSAYVLAGSARWAWQHSIPPTKELRYSVTFRTLRPAGDPST